MADQAVTFHLNEQSLQELQQALLAWFSQHQRPFPWRRSREVYPIWVSEVMLQQTVAAAAVPYFTRFLETLPTLKHLAEADEQKVLKLWSGLGYYRRAKFLHQAAQRLFRDYGEHPPADPAVWAALPGIGRYTLGAVLSQAFDAKLPILEANTLRVLSRWFALRDDPRTTPGQKQLWHLAELVLPNAQCGDFNQAMMELGSLICTVEKPRCGQCPVRRFCSAYQQNLQTELPLRAKRAEKVPIQEAAILVQQEDTVWLVQRPPTARRWAGFWEFPHETIDDPSHAAAQALALAKHYFGVTISKVSPFVTIRHGVTRYQITMRAYLGEISSKKLPSGPLPIQRVKIDKAAPELPLASAQKRLWVAWVNAKSSLFPE